MGISQWVEQKEGHLGEERPVRYWDRSPVTSGQWGILVLIPILGKETEAQCGYVALGHMSGSWRDQEGPLWGEFPSCLQGPPDWHCPFPAVAPG